MKANSKRIKPSTQVSLFLTLLLGVSGHILPARAQSPGTFTATGNMTTARSGHTATLLLDGKVLIAGGFDGRAYGALASTELYDPTTGTFTSSGNMITARSWHTATLLPDGKVLIAGGEQLYISRASAELYDPETGVFTATGDMTTASSYHTATLLNNGQVLIAGGGNYHVVIGGDIEVTPRSSGELYNPATGKFAATGSMTVPLSQPTATLLADGTVLVASPNFFPNIPLVLASQVQSFGATSEVYDPLTGAFRLNNNGDGMFYAHTATLLPSGKVLLAGGACLQCQVVLASSLLYDPTTGTFTPTGPMGARRGGHTANLLPDGTVLIIGSTGAEVYFSLTGTFSPTGNATTSRPFNSKATLLNNGYVLITGGSIVAASAELYHPAVLVSAPLLFSLSGDGNGQGAIWRSATGQVVSPSMPAFAGEVLTMYTTSLAEGSEIPPQVAIGGKLAEILFFGDAPGYPGFNQVNVRVPDGIATGVHVPVRLIYLGRTSNEVTLAVR